MTYRIKWSDSLPGLDGVIAVAQAFKDGKRVQRKLLGEWVECSVHDPIFAKLTYRIGEEVRPREFWHNEYVDGVCVMAHASERDANLNRREGFVRCIHMREVIE